MERSGEMLEKAKDKVEDIGDKILTAGEKAYHSVKNLSSKTSPRKNRRKNLKSLQKAETRLFPDLRTATPITDPDLLLEAPEEQPLPNPSAGGKGGRRTAAKKCWNPVQALEKAKQTR
jgi:hypothetical protein